MSMFGMNSPDGEAAVRTVVDRLAGAPIDKIALELPGAVALIASMHPEIREPGIVEAIADQLLLSH